MKLFEIKKDLQAWLKGSKVTDALYHGTDTPLVGMVKMPFFCTDSKSDVEFYGDLIYTVYLNLKNPLDSRRIKHYTDHDSIESIAKRAGIECEGTGKADEFYCYEITKHSPNDGYNSSDLIYIPAVRDQIAKEGHDGMILSDVMTNYEIDVWLPLRADQVWIAGKEKKNEEGDYESI